MHQVPNFVDCKLLQSNAYSVSALQEVFARFISEEICHSSFVCSLYCSTGVAKGISSGQAITQTNTLGKPLNTFRSSLHFDLDHAQGPASVESTHLCRSAGLPRVMEKQPWEALNDESWRAQASFDRPQLPCSHSSDSWPAYLDGCHVQKSMQHTPDYCLEDKLFKFSFK